MKPGDTAWRILRLSWPVLGGVLGGWVGVGGIFGLAYNPDSFGSLLASGMFAVFGCVGLLLGAAAGALIGRSAAFVLQRLGLGASSALIVATLVTALALWQIAGLVLLNYPGLRAAPARPASSAVPRDARSPGAAAAGPSTPGAPARSSCSDPPPTTPGERASWDTECR